MPGVAPGPGARGLVSGAGFLPARLAVKPRSADVAVGGGGAGVGSGVAFGVTAGSADSRGLLAIGPRPGGSGAGSGDGSGNGSGLVEGVAAGADGAACAVAGADRGTRVRVSAAVPTAIHAASATATQPLPGVVANFWFASQRNIFAPASAPAAPITVRARTPNCAAARGRCP